MTFGSDTWTEWSVKDMNQDGYPDLVSEDRVVGVCDGRDAPDMPRDAAHPWTQQYSLGYFYQRVATPHSERLSFLPCSSTTSGSHPMVFYNRLGAFVEFDMTPAMPTRWTMPTLAGLFHLERWFGGADTDQAVWVNGIDGPYLAALAAWRTSSWQTVRLADRTASGRLRSTGVPRHLIWR
ncbi:MAG: hypothetical protein IPL61_17110 [Myxococcales bacterium]|nr:hypothetical protein [Myxococcales bacterium]